MDDYHKIMKANERTYMYGNLIEDWDVCVPHGWNTAAPESPFLGNVEVLYGNGEKKEGDVRSFFWGNGLSDTSIIAWRSVKEPSSNWTAWNGAKKGEWRPSGLVDVVLRGGNALMERAASKLYWKHSGLDGDIIYWRYAQEMDGDTFPIIVGGRTITVGATIGATVGEKSAEKTQKPTNPKDAVGIKKAPLSTVSAAVLAEVGVGMLEGALKYGRHNYRGVGVRASVYYDATIRHLFSWWEGEDTDPDSQLSHVTKAICSLVVLRDAMIQGKCEDDRPPRSANFYDQLNELAAKNVEIYGDRNPHHYTIKDEGI